MRQHLVSVLCSTNQPDCAHSCMQFAKVRFMINNSSIHLSFLHHNYIDFVSSTVHKLFPPIGYQLLSFSSFYNIKIGKSQVCNGIICKIKWNSPSNAFGFWFKVSLSAKPLIMFICMKILVHLHVSFDRELT